MSHDWGCSCPCSQCWERRPSPLHGAAPCFQASSMFWSQSKKPQESKAWLFPPLSPGFPRLLLKPAFLWKQCGISEDLPLHQPPARDISRVGIELLVGFFSVYFFPPCNQLQEIRLGLSPKEPHIISAPPFTQGVTQLCSTCLLPAQGIPHGTTPNQQFELWCSNIST